MRRFLDDAADIGVKAISLVSDGESSVSPIYPEVIVMGSQHGLSMAMGTNGYLVTADKLKQILPHLTYLRFNITAAEPKRYAQIHGVPEAYFHQVCRNIMDAVEIKRKGHLSVTLGLQMVLMPKYGDQILPLARLGRELGPDYLVIKHCSDDEKGSLGVDYSAYRRLYGTLREAEGLSTETYLVKVKWSKIEDEGRRRYVQCYGPPFILQLSGSGLVAPCGMLFGQKYRRYWIGNIVDTSFKEIWQSERYWKVMNEIASPRFDARTMCGCLCLQHKVNEFLWDLKQGKVELAGPAGPAPMHVSFV
jgi:MoaA/NifB/PqqE/SkfB family radical SAM enzyme